MGSLPLSIGFNATGSLPLSIGFNATGSLPFQLASMPRVHCHFQLASMPQVPYLSFGLMPRVDCHFQLPSLPYLGYIACPIGIPRSPHASRRPNAFAAPKFALVAPHLPLWQRICLNGTPHALWYFICLTAPQCLSQHPNLP